MRLEPKEPKPITPTIDDIKREYKSSVPDGHLTRGMERILSDGYLIDARDANGKREVLDSIMLVGDAALGVSRVCGVDGSTETVRISILPIGEHAGDVAERQSSSTLFSISPGDLNTKVRDNGAIQAWEDIVIGREAIAEKTGSADMEISRSHLVVRIRSNGSTKVVDSSTNGTTVITETDLMRDKGSGGLSDTTRHLIAEFIKPLAESPWAWRESYADQRVVSPY